MKKPLKIAILSFYSGHFERGAENWAHEVSKRIGSTYSTYILQNGANTKREAYTIISVKVNVNWSIKDKTFTFWRRLFLDYWSLKVLRWTIANIKTLWNEKFDVVIPIDGGWQVMLVRIITWLYGGKMIVVGHSGRGWDERINLWSFPDYFVSLTKTNELWAKKVNPFVKTAFIPNGVDLDEFSVSGKKVPLGIEKPIIVAVGAPQKNKRLDLVIKAVSKLKKVSLLILGGGYDATYIRDLGHKLLGDRFKMLQVPYGDVSNYLRASDVFTLPSWKNEAFGMVYLEAMACNLPVVATNDPIRREIIGNAGILIDPTDIDAYSKALEKAINIEWGTKPRMQAEKFSWERVSESYIGLLESI